MPKRKTKTKLKETKSSNDLNIMSDAFLAPKMMIFF